MIYSALYRYLERQEAVAVPEVVRSVDHALLKPQDEFETDAHRDQRIQQWLEAAKRIYIAHLASTEYEVFGLRVPPEAAQYSPDGKEWRLPFPMLPGIPTGYDTDNGVPKETIARIKELKLPLSTYTPVESEWESMALGFGPHGIKRARVVPSMLAISMPELDRAQAIRDRSRNGQVFYYVRFAPEIVTDWHVGPKEQPVRDVTYDLFLQPVSVAIYTTNPVETLAVFGRGARDDLWFLERPDLGRPASTGPRPIPPRAAARNCASSSIGGATVAPRPSYRTTHSVFEYRSFRLRTLSFRPTFAPITRAIPHRPSGCSG